MMAESRYWKDALLEIAKRLRNRRPVEKMTDDHYGMLEQDLLVGFYSLRKLIESITKLTDDTKKSTIDVTYYLNIHPVNHLNKDDLDRVYDLENPNVQTIKLWDIASVFIHSYILSVCADEYGALDSVFVTSSRLKEEKLYHVTLVQICDAFDKVGNDYPEGMEWRRLDDGGEAFVVK